MTGPSAGMPGRIVMRGLQVMVIAAVLMLSASSWAALPLITDDAGTQGRGKFLLEAGGSYDRDRETLGGLSVREFDYSLASVVTYGIAEPVDVFVGALYSWQATGGAESPSTGVKGISDLLIGAKWRFFEKGGLGFALKPVVMIPTGNDEKGLGSGKVDYGVFAIVSKETAPWSFMANAGYVRNENDLDEQKDLWHLSFAATYEVARGLKVCADIGRDTNRDKTSEVEPAYLLAGIIYSVGDDLDLSLGFKVGMNKAETDYSILPGVTYRF